MDPKEHDKFRGKRFMAARHRCMEHVRMQECPLFKYNSGTLQRIFRRPQTLLDYSKDKRYTTLLNVATPAGMWSDLAEIMVDEADKAYLIEMRKKYKNILRNLWDPFDRKRERIIGCNTNRLYITPAGDVLPCPYVHKIGIFTRIALLRLVKKVFASVISETTATNASPVKIKTSFKTLCERSQLLSSSR